MRVKCLAQEHKTMPLVGPELKLRPLKVGAQTNKLYNIISQIGFCCMFHSLSFTVFVALFIFWFITHWHKAL